MALFSRSAGGPIAGLQKQNKKPHSKHPINLERSLLKDSLSLGQYDKVSVGLRFSHKDSTLGW